MNNARLAAHLLASYDAQRAADRWADMQPDCARGGYLPTLPEGGYEDMTKSRRSSLYALSAVLALTMLTPALADAGLVLREHIDAHTRALTDKVIDWRRDIHAHPELGNAERRTAEKVAKHLRSLGLDVRTGIAETGVVAVLRGSRSGPVVALRADMDALPVKEPSGLPFASTDQGQQADSTGTRRVDVMHACGHDAHTAILMGTATVLSALRKALPGTIVFYFQPAEEGPSDFVPDGKHTWGAKRMIEEGLMNDPRPAAVFGLHVWSGIPAGQIAYHAGPFMAASDRLTLIVTGKQTHAARPWDGIDPILLSTQLVQGLIAIPNRQTSPYATPSLISFGVIHGGIRYNIIPDSVEINGTIRAYDETVRKSLHERVRRFAHNTAEATGGHVDVTITQGYDATINNPELLNALLPALRWAARGDIKESPPVGAAEDFAFYAQRAPGLFFFLGITPRTQDMAAAAPNHSPDFVVDESALATGVRALSVLATDFLVARTSAP